MHDSYHLRAATEADAADISRVVLPFCPLAAGTPQGDAFRATLSADAMRERLCQAEFHFIVALDAGEVVGVVSMKSMERVSHLFVDSRHHGKGLGRALWQAILAYARARGNAGRISVNADPQAVASYQRFGFVVAGERTAPHGVPFVPMVFDEEN